MIGSKNHERSPPTEDTATLAESPSKEAEGGHKGSLPLISLILNRLAVKMDYPYINKNFFAFI